MNKAFLCLGGNLGDRAANLQYAKAQIQERIGKITRRSSVYETESWGSESDNQYLNQVILVETVLSPNALLKEVNAIEKKLGRKRTSEQYADRYMDIDILFYNEAIVNEPGLVIPHPRLHLRNFVLHPLSEISPTLLHPALKQSIGTLVKKSKDPHATRRLLSRPGYICIEGNIGSGKTTLAEGLAKHMNARFISEAFENNHLLPLFYSDPDLYSFPLEYSFLISRFEQLKDIGHEQNYITDFSIYRSLWFASVNLKGAELKLFRKHFKAFADQLPVPDLVVYLRTGRNNLRKNIKSRARSYEQRITGEYLEDLETAYRKGVKRLRSLNILEIEIKRYDRKLGDELVTSIENHVKEILQR